MDKFIITKLPIRTVATINGGSPLLANVEYDMALESTIVLTNPHPYKGEPFDFLSYKVKKDDANTINEGVVSINFRTDKTTNPVYDNKTRNIDINASKLFSDIISPQNVFDRIQITSISGKGTWLLAGSPLKVNSIIMWYDLVDSLQFVADTQGSKDLYNTLTWKYANKINTFPGTNTLRFNAKSLSKIVLLESVEIEQDPASLIKQFSFLFTIENGPENGTYEFNIDTTEFFNFATNPLNVFTLSKDNAAPVLYDTPAASINVSSSMNEFGKVNYELIVSIDETYAVENKLKLSLTNVNSDPALIDPLYDEINLIIPAP